MLVIPPQLALYMALAPEEKLTYKEAGPAGQATFEAGVAGFEAKAVRPPRGLNSGAHRRAAAAADARTLPFLQFRGCGVVTSEPYEVSDDQDSVQMCAAPLAHAPPRTRSHAHALALCGRAGSPARPRSASSTS